MEIVSYQIDIGSEGQGFMTIELANGEVIPSITFSDLGNLNVVCSMLTLGAVEYREVEGGHTFRLKKP